MTNHYPIRYEEVFCDSCANHVCLIEGIGGLHQYCEICNNSTKPFYVDGVQVDNQTDKYPVLRLGAWVVFDEDILKEYLSAEMWDTWHPESKASKQALGVCGTIKEFHEKAMRFKGKVTRLTEPSWYNIDLDVYYEGTLLYAGLRISYDEIIVAENVTYNDPTLYAKRLI